ncbi:SUKH-4 family immunity protein [Pseudomonas sp. 3A(2025)]
MDLGLDEFVVYERDLLASLAVQDADFLVEQGLPCDAAPFLSFAAYTEAQRTHRLSVFGIGDDYFPIGHNGSGDVLAIERSSREVVYLNHDFNNERVFINSTLLQFAECLCIFQEHLRDNRMAFCLTEIERIDPAAARPGTMWAEAVKEAFD